MTEHQINSLLQRLDALVQRNRWWKRIACTALAFLGVVLFLGATGSQEVRGIEELRVKRLVLVDKDGKRRAMLGIETPEENPQASGSTALIFYTNNDQPVALRAPSNGNGTLSISGKGGIAILSGASLMLFEENKAMMSISARAMELEAYPSVAGISPSVALSFDPADGPALTFKDQNLFPRIQLSLTAGGTPQLAFFDQSGRPYSAGSGSQTESLLNAAPALYSACLQRKQSNPSLDCSEYGRAVELIIRALGR
jgi:hypothetical protein